ncbi:hypothetical protein [Coleofasciculus sp. E2-BRE-01]|uniref:hypothetical protein n=1 Tax=Coleofasciculus sp. E2-BRE-01 TaxID=3069524 RepID=UPI003301C724
MRVSGWVEPLAIAINDNVYAKPSLAKFGVAAWESFLSGLMPLMTVAWGLDLSIQVLLGEC